jgi:hypothetical protein
MGGRLFLRVTNGLVLMFFKVSSCLIECFNLLTDPDDCPTRRRTIQFVAWPRSVRPCTTIGPSAGLLDLGATSDFIGYLLVRARVFPVARAFISTRQTR